MKCKVAAACVLLGLCAAAAPAPRDERVFEFRQRFPEGVQYQVLISNSMQIGIEYHAFGRVVDHLDKQEASQTKAKVTIVECQDGTPVSERVEFDASSGTFGQTTGQKVKDSREHWAGKTVTVRRNASGETHCDVEGEHNTKLSKMMRGWLDRDRDIYPTRPVQIGEKWDVSQHLRDKLGFDDAQVVTICRLKAVKEVHGRQIAELSVSTGVLGTLEKVVQLEGGMDGIAFVDMGTGRIIRIDMTGHVQASGSGDVHTRDGRMVNIVAMGDGTLEYHELSKPIRGNGAPVASGKKTNKPSSSNSLDDTAEKDPFANIDSH